MKVRYFFSVVVFLVYFSAYAQEESKSYWSFTPFFTYNYLTDGHLNVNDPKFPEDTISLEQDIGKTVWSNIGGVINHTCKNGSSFNISGEYFFISGIDTTSRNIWFNSVLLGSKQGITIDHSRLIRVQAFYEKLLNKPDATTRFAFLAGLLYDFLLVKIDARILNDTDAALLHEDFNDQLIPYPQIGFRFEKDLSQHNHLVMQAAGTYIPRMSRSDIKRKLESFQYYCVNSIIGYQYSDKHWSFGPGITYRMFRTAEDEGKHDFYISLLGENASVTYKF
jgi:hypothetical protein